MKSVTVELTPDPELGGYTPRVPDIPAYGEGETEETGPHPAPALEPIHFKAAFTRSSHLKSHTP